MAIYQVFLAILLAFPVVLLITGWIKGRRQSWNPPDKESSTFLIVFNSAMLYALTYNLVYCVQELFLCLGKQCIGLTSYLYHNNHNWEGSDPRDALMQGTGATSILIGGLIMLYVYSRARNRKSWGSLFILWAAFHGLVQSLPQFLTAGMDPGSDTGQAIAYLNLPFAVNILIALASLVAIIAVSYQFSRYFLALGHPSHVIDHPFRRFRTIWQTAVLPALFGTLILFPYRIPPVDRYTMTVTLLIVSTPWIFAFAWVGKVPKSMGNVAWARVLILPVILMIVVLAFFQLVLRPGVVFPGY